MRFCCSLRCHYLKCNSRKKEICEEIFGWLFCALYFCVSPFFVFCLIAAKKNRKESGTVKSWRESCALQMIAFFKVDDNRQRIEWNRERATTIMRQLIYVVMVHFPFFFALLCLLKLFGFIAYRLQHTYQCVSYIIDRECAVRINESGSCVSCRMRRRTEHHVKALKIIFG